MLRAVALYDEETARFERAFEVGKKSGTVDGVGRDEDRGDYIEGILGPAPIRHVRDFGRKFHAALLRQRARLGKRGRGIIDREDVEALFGEPDAVAALAVGYGKCGLARAQQMHLGLEKRVRLLAKKIVWRTKPCFPSLPFGHAPAPRHAFFSAALLPCGRIAE